MISADTMKKIDVKKEKKAALNDSRQKQKLRRVYNHRHRS